MLQPTQISNTKKFREQWAEIRHVAKAFILARTAVIIIQKARAGDVDEIYKEAKNMKVKLHKELRTWLDALKSS